MRIKELKFLLLALLLIVFTGCGKEKVAPPADLSDEYKEVRSKANKEWNKLD